MISCIDVHGLSKLYGSTVAVDDITLSVPKGKVFGFLGPNGAGKSTTIKLLTTLITPSAGKINILGINAVQNPLQVRHRIGVVLQQPSYEPSLSVEKSLDKYGMMWNVPKSTRKQRVEELLHDFDLGGIRKKRNVDLSIGQRRRVQVAREFMHDMDLLFLDEPTVGLDPAARRTLLDYLKKKVSAAGLTIFYTTHILSEAEYLCDDIAIINKGKIVMVDSPEALKNKLGREKTIRLRLQAPLVSKVYNMICDIPGCTIDTPNNDTGTQIIVHSERSELALFQVLKILSGSNIAIEDLSAIPVSLEDVFLKMVKEPKV